MRGIGCRVPALPLLRVENLGQPLLPGRGRLLELALRGALPRSAARRLVIWVTSVTATPPRPSSRKNRWPVSATTAPPTASEITGAISMVSQDGSSALALLGREVDDDRLRQVGMAPGRSAEPLAERVTRLAWFHDRPFGRGRRDREVLPADADELAGRTGTGSVPTGAPSRPVPFVDRASRTEHERPLPSGEPRSSAIVMMQCA